MAEFDLVTPRFSDVYPFISPQSGMKDAAKGRTVIITGAASGIGKAIAIAFAEAKAEVIVIVGRTEATLNKVRSEMEENHLDTKVIAEIADVSDTRSVAQLFERLEGQGIRANVLVNNAGVNLSRETIAESDPDLWWKNYEIMLKGPYLCSRAFLRALNGDSGAIVMVSSMGAYALLPTSSAYGSCKAALTRLTEWIALEHHDKVHAVSFHPGGVKTNLTSTAPAWFQERWLTEAPELAACVAVYLSTPRAAWLSGRYIDARWDLEELESHKQRVNDENLLKMNMLGCVRPSGLMYDQAWEV